MFSKLLGVDLSPSLANKCARSRRFGPSLLIQRRVTWNAPNSRNSFRCVTLVFGCNLLLNALFQRLNGVFEVRIYPVEYNFRNILSVCKDPLDKQAWRARVVEGVDLTKLEQIVDGIDSTEIRKRRAVYSRIYHEAIDRKGQKLKRKPQISSRRSGQMESSKL